MRLVVNNLKELYSFADFIANSIGDYAEVVIHDLTDVECSILYIINGHLTGRSIGDATTVFSLKLVQDAKRYQHDYVANYSGRNMNNKHFRSSTYFIKNKQNEIIGLFCINIDITGLDSTLDILTSLTKKFDYDGSLLERITRPVEEILSSDPLEAIKNMIQQQVSLFSVPFSRLTKEEKLEILNNLDKDGIFLMKGSIRIVAEELEISEPTLYRYLKELS